MELKQKINWKNIGKEKLILFGLAGILFIGASYFESVGDSKKTEEIPVTETHRANDFQNDTESEIKKLVETIQGVSHVCVVVTLQSGSEKVVQEDREERVDENENGSRNSSLKKSTVIMNQNGNDTPYVIKELYPRVEGIAVTAKGVSKGNRESQIIHMLSALFDIPIHKISVIEID